MVDRGTDRDQLHSTVAYEQAWRDCQRVYTLGRYVALKLLEFMTRYCGAPIELPDIRPAGGWSPRLALALLFPADEEPLRDDDSTRNLHIANVRAGEAWRWLSNRGIEISRYNLQVLLCDWKQSYKGHRQFPGRSHDSELEYLEAVREHWRAAGIGEMMFRARRELFPERALGEMAGWNHVRKELGEFLHDTGETWSDLKFDYVNSRDCLALPVRWPE